MTPKQFRKIIFKYDIDVEHGALWANDKFSLIYGYSNITSADAGLLNSLLGGGYEIISCEYQTGTVNYTTEERQIGTFLGRPIYKTYYIYDGTINWNNNWKNLSGSDIQSTNWLTERPYINNGLTNYLKKYGIESESYKYEVSQSNNTPASSLQIRCVKE